jgi:valyl-tRNA synthetase
VPENWKNTYFEWMRNIEDWCISRQIWWGHRIPAWYDGEGNVYVGRSEAEVRKRHDLADDYALAQDPDVLDTWFSSALWPFSTLGWPERTDRLETFYPTSVLVTGFDIIFFWVARMIMMGLKFMDDVPFREVYIHGLVRDSQGQKMSKSKGNVLDPIDLIDGIDLEALVAKRTTGLMQPEMAPRIEKATRKEFPDGIPAYGTDALRFTFASQATLGRDIKFDLGRIEGYRNFCNKLWNASRYVLMNTEGEDNVQGSTSAAGGRTPGAADVRGSTSAVGGRTPGAASGKQGAEVVLSLADRWIISRLQEVERHVAAAIDEYRFDHAAQAIYSFVWDEYCDWYLELTKPVLNDPASSPEARRGTRRTLVRVLETILRLGHPIMPFITEELWQRVAPLAGREGETIMLQPYPRADESRIDAASVAEMQWVMAVVTGVRNIRGERNISPGKALPVLLQDAAESDLGYLERNRGYLESLARIESLSVLEPGAEAPESVAALVGNMKVLVPLGKLIDVAAEVQRLDRELEKRRKELAGIEAKLTNPNFVGKAPAAVVDKQRTRAEEIRTAVGNLEAQRSKVQALA